MLPRPEGSKIGAVLFHSLAMITCSDRMLSHADVKSLKEKLDDAFAAVLSTAGTTGTWTISLEVEVRAAAGACITSDGAAPTAIESATELSDLEPSND